MVYVGVVVLKPVPVILGVCVVVPVVLTVAVLDCVIEAVCVCV